MSLVSRTFGLDKSLCPFISLLKLISPFLQVTGWVSITHFELRMGPNSDASLTPMISWTIPPRVSLRNASKMRLPLLYMHLFSLLTPKLLLCWTDQGPSYDFDCRDYLSTNFLREPFPDTCTSISGLDPVLNYMYEIPLSHRRHAGENCRFPHTIILNLSTTPQELRFR